MHGTLTEKEKTTARRTKKGGGRTVGLWGLSDQFLGGMFDKDVQFCGGYQSGAKKRFANNRQAKQAGPENCFALKVAPKEQTTDRGGEGFGGGTRNRLLGGEKGEGGAGHKGKTELATVREEELSRGHPSLRKRMVESIRGNGVRGARERRVERWGAAGDTVNKPHRGDLRRIPQASARLVVFY